MFKKEFRLTKEQDIQRVYKKGRVFREEEVIVRVLENRRGVSRIAFVVGKKQYPKAYQRNKIKRRLREGVRQFFPQTKQSNDIIISLQRPFKEEKFENITELLKKIFQKGKLLNG